MIVFSLLARDWELAHLRRKQLGGGLKSLAAVALLALAAAGTVSTAFAQDSWVFNNEIPCATAPVYGVPFNQCWTSNVRTFRIGNVQSWRLTYTDSKSEFAIGLYRLVAAHGVGGLSAVSSSSAVDWLRTADALKNVTTGASGWTLRGSTRRRSLCDVPESPAPVHRLRAQRLGHGGAAELDPGRRVLPRVGLAHTDERGSVRRRCRQGQGLSGQTCRAVPACGLFDHDFDATVLRLAHAVGGLDQKALLATADHGDVAAGTPSRTNAFLTAFARRSDSAML